MRLIDSDELKKEFDIIASKSATGSWQLIPIKHIKQIIDNTPEVELADHIRDRIKDIDHEITIPQSYEAKCFLDGKRKAFQYVLDLLKGGVENE